MKINPIQNQGFTIIETLVAITILMIAIAGPLTIANKALLASLDAKNVMIASNLAQESLEYVKNLKDNNVYANDPDWLDTTGISLSLCTANNPCAVSAVPGQLVQPCDPTSSTGCNLYIDPGLGYDYDNTGSSTPFKRYVYLTGNPNTHTTTTEPNGYIDALVTVVVSWSTGPASNQVQVQSLMSNVMR